MFLYPPVGGVGALGTLTILALLWFFTGGQLD
jgi:hypothetical protein